MADHRGPSDVCVANRHSHDHHTHVFVDVSSVWVPSKKVPEGHESRHDDLSAARNLSLLQTAHEEPFAQSMQLAMQLLHSLPSVPTPSP